MTKLARVICIFFIIFFFSSALPVSAGFQDLINLFWEYHPSSCHAELVSASNSNGIPNQVRDDGRCENIIAPSVTFGDLLIRENPQVTPTPDNTQLLEKTAKLKKLLAELEASSNKTLKEFEIKRGYPTPTLTDTLLLASLLKNVNPTSSPQPPTTNHQPPTNNILGAITRNTTKSSYTIALLGDSMTDTLGRDLPHLKNLLKQNYPNYTFSLLNYGYGSTDMESGLFRLTNTTNYLSVSYPALLSLKPDILVLESFAYNHWSGEKYDLDRQWVTVAKIIDTVREKSPDTKIILGASIAPNKYIFGDGVLNWGMALKENSTLIIKAYLQNMVNFATSEKYPLADAYHPTLDSKGNGIEQFINSSDHLHPSPEGALLYSEKIMEAIKTNGLIN